MKLAIYSDLHLEFDIDFIAPDNDEADIMILAGDTVTFDDFSPLIKFLKNWQKPVLFIAGNHEYYAFSSMEKLNNDFKIWLSEHLPNVVFLQNEDITIGGVNFFAGTMWTNFNNQNFQAMQKATLYMNDYRRIVKNAKDFDFEFLKPIDTVNFHHNFVEKLKAWFNKNLEGKRVVISHHAPIFKQDSKYPKDDLSFAFVSDNMVDVILDYEPDLWIYGHTHETDNQTIGKTRIVANSLGYPKKQGYECQDFDPKGLLIEV